MQARNSINGPGVSCARKIRMYWLTYFEITLE